MNSVNFACYDFSEVRRCKGACRRDTQHESVGVGDRDLEEGGHNGLEQLQGGRRARGFRYGHSQGVLRRQARPQSEQGVTFEQYDQPGLKTDEKGIATFEGDAKVAYFKGPDGHTLSIAQAPRS